MAQNNKIQRKFNAIICCILKSILASSDSFRLITSHILFTFKMVYNFYKPFFSEICTVKHFAATSFHDLPKTDNFTSIQFCNSKIFTYSTCVLSSIFAGIYFRENFVKFVKLNTVPSKIKWLYSTILWPIANTATNSQNWATFGPVPFYV